MIRQFPLPTMGMQLEFGDWLLDLRRAFETPLGAVLCAKRSDGTTTCYLHSQRSEMFPRYILLLIHILNQRLSYHTLIHSTLGNLSPLLTTDHLLD